jgi:hypothetical protein
MALVADVNVMFSTEPCTRSAVCRLRSLHNQDSAQRREATNHTDS